MPHHRTLWVAWLALATCQSSVAEEHVDDRLPPSVANEVRQPVAKADVPSPPEPPDPPEPPEPPPATVAERKPTEVRVSRRTLLVHRAPMAGAELRGRIPPNEPFAIYARAEGPRCRAGWADVGGGFVCLDSTRNSDAEPQDLPRLIGRELTPFYYAKLRSPKGETSSPEARRWRTRWQLYRGEASTDLLEPEHDYAFIARKRRRGGAVLVDRRRRAVLERDVRRFRPSKFAGVELDGPVPPGQMMAWVVDWPKTPAYERTSEKAKVVRKLRYHARIFVKAEPIQTRRGVWFEVADERGGFIHDRWVQRWLPGDRPEQVGPDETWIDVELDEQTLTVMRGDEPQFVTLVSTGLKDPTPRGLFRIRTKQAYGDMRSRPSDEEDPYHVEGVPWVQYFVGRYALHGTYWHGRFGHRASHGCINLSPKDAAYVFSLSSPRVPGGWLHAHEYEGDPGTLVRIRYRNRPVKDRRAPFDSPA